MSWQKKSSGLWQAPLSSFEDKYYKLYSQPEDKREFSVCPSVTLDQTGGMTGTQLVAAVREAWKGLRWHYPVIAATVKDDMKLYQTADNIQTWADSTFIVRDEENSETSFAEPGRADTTLLIFYPKSSELILRLSHWVSDHIGSLMLLNRLLTILAEQPWTKQEWSWGEEVENLTAAFDQALSLPKPADSPPEVKAYIQQMMGAVIAAGPSAGIQYQGNSSTGTGRALKKTVIFSRASTAELVVACKSHGYTVTAAVHTAVLMSTFFFTPHKQRHAVTTILRNLRDGAPKQLSSDKYAATPAVSAQLIAVPPPDLKGLSAFETTGGAVKRAYGSDFCGRETWVRCLEEMVAIFGMLLSMPPDPDALPSTPFVSSAGILQKYLAPDFVAADQSRRITVKDVHLHIGNNVRELGIYVYTWNDQLRLNCCYNEAYHNEDVVDKFLAYTIEALEHGLEISLRQS